MPRPDYYTDQDAYDLLMATKRMVVTGICREVGPILNRFRFMESSKRADGTYKLGTLAVSYKGLFLYNPDFVMGRTKLKLKAKELIVGVMHEIGHIMYGHGRRCGHRDHRGWNIAGDREINKELRDLTYETAAGETIRLNMPSWAMFPEQIGAPSRGPAATAEVYYDVAKANPPKPKDPKKPQEYQVGDFVKPTTGPYAGQKCVVTKVTPPDPITGKQTVEFGPVTATVLPPQPVQTSGSSLPPLNVPYDPDTMPPLRTGDQVEIILDLYAPFGEIFLGKRGFVDVGRMRPGQPTVLVGIRKTAKPRSQFVTSIRGGTNLKTWLVTSGSGKPTLMVVAHASPAGGSGSRFGKKMFKMP